VLSKKKDYEIAPFCVLLLPWDWCFTYKKPTLLLSWQELKNQECCNYSAQNWESGPEAW